MPTEIFFCDDFIFFFSGYLFPLKTKNKVPENTKLWLEDKVVKENLGKRDEEVACGTQESCSWISTTRNR